MDAKVPRKVRRMVPLCPAASMRLCGGLSANGPRAASPESGGCGAGRGRRQSGAVSALRPMNVSQVRHMEREMEMGLRRAPSIREMVCVRVCVCASVRVGVWVNLRFRLSIVLSLNFELNYM